MFRKWWFLAIVPAAAMTLFAADKPIPGTRPATKPAGNPNVCQVKHCIVTLIDDVNIPATEAGAVVELFAKEGDVVTKGSPVAHLYAEDVQAKLGAAKAEHAVSVKQSENDAEVRVAEKAADVTREEYRKNEDIRKKNPLAVSDFEIRRSLFQWEQQKEKIKVAEMEHDIAKLTVNVKGAQMKVVENEIQRRKIISPIDGIVVQINRQVGEWLQPGDAIARVVRMNKLRVEGFVDANTYLPEDLIGRPVTVKVKLPVSRADRKRGVTEGRSETLKGRVDFVSPLVEASNDYRVRAEFDNLERNNFWVIRPGLSAEMEIELGL